VSAASTAEAPGSAVTTWPARRGAHQLETRVGHKRCAGIGHERDRGAGGEPGDKLRPRFGGVVVVIGRQRRRDGVMVEEFSGDPCVLAGDQVGCGQDLERAQRDVAQIADRGSDEM
jgi:hypothetical protein